MVTVKASTNGVATGRVLVDERSGGHNERLIPLKEKDRRI
jgi:hypothetical protein